MTDTLPGHLPHPDTRAENDTGLPVTTPFGCWPSAISADLVAGKSPRLAEPRVHNGQIFWLQSLPEEKGRITVMSKPLDAPPDQEPRSLLPRPLSAKSKVHEYGGGSYCLHKDQLYFVLADDQQVYRVDLSSPQCEPEVLTSSDCQFSRAEDNSLRFADLVIDPKGDQLLAVCEQHFLHIHREPVTRLVTIPLDASGQLGVLAEGDDFYSSACVSHCGRFCAWLSWRHPDMPWDATRLWLAERGGHGRFENAHPLMTDTTASRFLPRFSPGGDLYFVSDASNWWNLYRISAAQLGHSGASAEPVTHMEAEFATPQWTFGMSTYDFLNADEILATYTRDGNWYLASIALSDSGAITSHQQAMDTQNAELTVIHGIHCHQDTAVFVGASPTSSTAIYQWHQSQMKPVLATESQLDAAEISVPQPFLFPTSAGSDTAHGFYYPPHNSRYHNHTDKPPLIVICHGGPTGATDNALNYKIQYWTNRGFAVLDVNYRGSTGFGREFRHALHGQWGIYDVEDVCSAARFAVSQGWANPEQLIIKGSSAGGYTVLAALTFSTDFNAGVSLYGIGDLETLVRDTHKFEARYLDKLVGEYPMERSEYQQRSPIHFVDNISCPLLVFQGLEDKVVPPNQAEDMVNAVRNKGLTVEYITFEDEGHGFRNAHNITTMLEEEQRFYQRVFGLGEASDSQV